ncbi:uncharacterized protein LOC122497691 [Leptopilina heterotoma]|uniref:uncharacterized protein LOC122497691 n=1 Tax=Leptopilina heterotoma TaxID=63436 RepID=UPI001CA9439A|nr:uncharacterized protein LOC122497691 [Leptopilina heterotoma]
MTKPKNNVWDYFRPKKNINGNLEGYACIFCDILYQKNATRQKKHLNKCSKCQEDIKKIFNVGLETNKSKSDMSYFFSVESSDNALTTENEDDQILQVSGDNIISTKSKDKMIGSNQPKLFTVKNYHDSITSNEQNELDEHFARAIYSSGTPLSLFENKYWGDFLKKLRPAWKKPSRHKLSEPLLKTEFRIVQQDIFTKVAEASVVGIQCNGWSNRRNESIINVIVTTLEPVFMRPTTQKMILIQENIWQILFCKWQIKSAMKKCYRS